jgi:hypothetical protein
MILSRYEHGDSFFQSLLVMTDKEEILSAVQYLNLMFFIMSRKAERLIVASYIALILIYK